MTQKHTTPEVLKTKLKEEVALISKLKGDLAIAEQRLQDVIGAYILGAGLPQQGIKFDESFDLIFETQDSAGESVAEDEVEDQDGLAVEMEVVASKSPAPKKTKVR